MRRTIALALMMAFSWTLIAPIFGPDADANLPPCCRRHGKHHCMMRMMERFGGNQTGFTSVREVSLLPSQHLRRSFSSVQA